MSKMLLLEDSKQLADTSQKNISNGKFKLDNPKLGITYKILSGFVICINLLCMKVLYEYHPELSSI